MSEKQGLKVLIAGAGAISEEHIDAYNRFPEWCRIVGVCDLFEEKALELIRKKGLEARAYTDYTKALEESGADLVSICLPLPMHVEASVAALNRGKHVLCEKPMARSLEECDIMLEAARRNGKLLSIVGQNRYKTPHQKLKTLLDSGIAGEIQLVTVNSLWWRGESYYDLEWRGSWESEGGGCVTNHAVHHLDLLLWMMGKPESVTAVIANVGHDNSQCEDVGLAIFTYPHAVVQLTASLVNHDEGQEIIFQCRKGRLSVPWYPAASKALGNGFPKEDGEMKEMLEESYRALPELSAEGHAGQVQNFLRAIRGEEELLIGGEQGKDTLELITAVYKSAYEKGTVRLPVSEGDPFYKKGKVAACMPHFHEKTRKVESSGGLVWGGTWGGKSVPATG